MDSVHIWKMSQTSQVQSLSAEVAELKKQLEEETAAVRLCGVDGYAYHEHKAT